MSNRCTFRIEFGPGQAIQIVIEGEVDHEMIDAAEAYLNRQKKRTALRRPTTDGTVISEHNEPSPTPDPHTAAQDLARRNGIGREGQ